MSMPRFSGVLQVTDLDDFIAPSQANDNFCDNELNKLSCQTSR